MKIDSAQMMAFDPVQSINVHANLTEADSLTKAAEQFEAIFLQLVLKNMHAASDALTAEEGMLFSSKEQQLFRDMYDAQLAQSMAETGQLGLAESMVRQLGEGLTKAENKFKQLADVVALQESDEIKSNGLYQYNGFSQPLLPPTAKDLN